MADDSSQKWSVLCSCSITLDAERDFDTVISQESNARARHQRVGILDCRNHPADAALDYRFGARSGSAVVTTGLERAEERRTSRKPTSHLQCPDFGMGSAGSLMMTLSYDDAFIVNDDGPYDGIGCRLTKTTLGQPKRPLHVVLV
jgi:hypothetical protein